MFPQIIIHYIIYFTELERTGKEERCP